MSLKITLGCGDYDRTKALMVGSIVPEGIDLTYLSLGPEEVFWRMLQFLEFDASEMSLSNYLIERSKDNPRFIAIPVFPARSFRHSFIFINTKSNIQTPQDLVGKKVGVPEYSMTATLWQRGLLEHEYNVKPSDMFWLTGGQEESGRKERISYKLPNNIKIKFIESGKTLNEMLRTGEIDALITASVPSCYYEPESPVKRLFEDYAELEIEYYKKTKIFPIMHTVVIRADIYERHPWVALSLYKAFCEAKDLCIKKLLDTGSLVASLPFLIPSIEKTLDVFGYNFWPYGVENNYITLEAICRYSFEQGLSKRKLSVEEIFAKNTYETYKI